MLRYLSNWFRRTLIILGMLIGLSPMAFADTSLERGTYTLTNNVTHDNAVGQGMARSYTEEQSDLVVSQDGLWFTLGFNNTQFMGDFTIKVNGSQTSYDVVYNSNNIKKLKFKIPSLDAKISVGMYVIPMNTTVEYTVTLNQGSLKLVEKEQVEETVPEQPVIKPETNTNSSSQAGSSNTQNNNQNAVTTPSKPSQEAASGNTSSSTPSQNTQSGTASQSKPNTDMQAGTVQTQTENQNEAKVEAQAADKTEESTEEKVEETAEQVEAAESEAETDAEEITGEENQLDVEGSNEADEQEAAEEITEAAQQGNFVGITIIIILIALAGGLYYWYFKKKK